jgi:metal-sulfur cluster biosynthetic enzyme
MICPRQYRPVARARHVLFLSLLLLGFDSLGAEAGQDAKPVDLPVGYWERNDRFEDKLKLLEAAWRNRDYEVVRALTHSLRDSAIQAQAEDEHPGNPVVSPLDARPVSSLPSAWQTWAQGWSHFQALQLEELQGFDRNSEPVEALISVPASQSSSLTREIRIGRVQGGSLKEVPTQVFAEVRREGARLCRVLFMADLTALEKATYLVFHGNPYAELPLYPSDLKVRGEGYGLDIENEHYRAVLSRQTGQLERLILKREHGLELFSGGEGHGEPPGIDWAHDYVDAGNFQKLRISLWESCPDFEVIQGPICTIVRRWGFPRSPVYPVFSPSRLNIAVEYRFYAGLPWFHKVSAMKAVKAFEAQALRDDEWVFTGQPFTEKIWMSSDGRFRAGDVDAKSQEDLWGVGLINRQTKDAFVGLFLEHWAEGLPDLRHNGVPNLNYRWHGQLWSRYPLPVKQVPAGAVLHQRNAYVVAPFEEAEGLAPWERMHQRLSHPLTALAGTNLAGISVKEPLGRLARSGERNEVAISKDLLWEAMKDCKDAQLYTADVNIVDLGLVHDVRVRGGVVTVVMMVPHRGRPLATYFSQGSISVHPTFSLPIRDRLMKVPGVTKVVVEQTWSPAWSSNRLTPEGRRRLGMPSWDAKSGVRRGNPEKD